MRVVRRCGFTLAELLTVIAVIAVLAAVLVPVLTEARASARQSQCAGNIRQIGLAMRLYLADFDERWFPAESYDPSGHPVRPARPWIGYDNASDMRLPAVHPEHPGAIDPYIKNRELKRCPGMPTGWQLAYALNMWYPRSDSAYYSVNPAARRGEYGPCSKETDSRGFFLGVADGEVTHPSLTLMIWEHDSERPVCSFLEPENWLRSPPDRQALRAHFNFLHRQGANGLWADGHVRRILYDQLRRPMFTCNKDLYPGFEL